MTYMDMKFCTYYEDCKDGETCHRALTPKVLADAEKWMENAPVCCYATKPYCHKPKEQT